MYDYLNVFMFLEHYPNSVSGMDACIMANNGQDQEGDAKLAWKNNNCEIRLQYVCEVPARYEPPTTQVPPTLLPPQPCDPNNPADLWVKFLEDQGGDGTAITHWEKRIFQDEAMTGTVHTKDPAYSRLTFALLEDTGWYMPNYQYVSL